ncbi:uncharacterized protein LOC103718854 [Phoenix dactylifera]|uniref:Uncharacterized protein LOC103718854 n=1 Tax=Phoenix dactylifera TaxID=42345 RepID=A0A8B7CTI1_PHODC|nr:uncharacterized protein LOC103718854 [Phoenix dactylifera]
MAIHEESEELRQPPPPPLFPGVEDDVGIGVPANRRRSFSYHRLPEQLIKLTIIKLDATSFDVQISRTAAVWQLKMAIENIFNNSAKDGGCNISWSLVWGHFCLSYEGFKLTDDHTTLRSFGIKDGDELHFMRHVSLNYSESNWRPHRRSVTAPEILEVIEENDKDKNGDYMDASPSIDEHGDNYDEGESLVRHKESKLGHFFRGWLSNSRSSRRSKSDDLSLHSKTVSNHQRVGSKVRQYQSNRNSIVEAKCFWVP